MAHPGVFAASYPEVWNRFELGIDTLLFLDILPRMLTPFHLRELSMLIDEPLAICLHYLRGRCVFDLIVACPVDLILRAAGIQGMWHVLRMAQIVRAFKVPYSLRPALASQRFKNYRSGWHWWDRSLPLLWPVSIVFLIWHWLACLWWFILRNEGTAILHMERWFTDEDGASTAYENAFAAYSVSIHWVLSMTTCLGANSSIKGSYLQALLEGFTAVIGTLMQTFIFGAAAAIVNRIDENRRTRLAKLETVRNFISERGVPSFIARRVIHFYEHISKRSLTASEEAELLEELPSTLRLQVAIVLNQGFLSRTAVFAKFDTTSVALLSLVLYQSSYLPGEVIIAQGAMNEELHFVRAGVVFVHMHDGSKEALRKSAMRKGSTDNRSFSKSADWKERRRSSVSGALESTSFLKGENDPILGKCVARLHEGAALGEQSFLTKLPCKASARAATFSELIALHRKHLEPIFDRDPALREIMNQYILEQRRKYEAELEQQSKSLASSVLRRFSSSIDLADTSKNRDPAIEQPSESSFIKRLKGMIRHGSASQAPVISEPLSDFTCGNSFAKKGQRGPTAAGSPFDNSTNGGYVIRQQPRDLPPSNLLSS